MKGKRMKKIGILAGIVLLATSVHAASYSWAFDAEGNDPFGGATYYAINGDAATYVTALSTQGYAAFTESLANADYTQNNLDNAGAASGLVSSDAAEVFSMIVLTSTDAGSTFYYATASTDDYLYTPPAGSPGDLAMYAFTELGDLDMSTGTIASSEVVPEPTSGLLMLLGLAGLALKRKHS